MRSTPISWVFGLGKEFVDPDPVIMPLQEPLDVKVARILVAGHAENPKLLQLEVEMLDGLTPTAVASIAVMIKDTAYLDQFLKDRAEREARYVAARDEERKA